MQTKLELINKIYSLENKPSLEAVEELRIRGWLADGSLRGVALCQAQLEHSDLMGADLKECGFPSIRPRPCGPEQSQIEWRQAQPSQPAKSKFRPS